jgi:hypothetical protein
MCDRCDEIEKTIERYRQLKQRITDEMLLRRAKELIAEFEADKAAMHPELKPR